MGRVTIHGIDVQYEVHGEGPPLLMFAPGGFDSTIQKWSTAGVWAKMDALKTLGQHYRCIAYDRRESGQSGGRVEHLHWGLYADEGKGLLDHLGIDQAIVLGGCMGVSVAIAFGTRYPRSTIALLLHWPVGGHKWRVMASERFTAHRNYVLENGLEGAVKMAQAHPSFWTEPRGGVWAPVLGWDTAFAQAYMAQDVDRYLALCEVSARILFDRDTAPGAEPEELQAMKMPALIIPGDDPAHAMSAAHYLRECLPQADFWPVGPVDQEPQRVAERLIAFGAAHS
jgi:pimeloyl-ACP methyl ester carboxylesterase